jgi:hypothetical protein
MTPVDFAHTTAAERARQDKAKQLARWCYARGVDVRVLELNPVVLRSIARQAGVNPPRCTGTVSATWQLVADLLTARTDWDHRHNHASPAPAQCLVCAVRAGCAHHPVPTR